jgi:hypothetical protein
MLIFVGVWLSAAPPVIPEPPASVTITAVNSTELRVSWMPSTDTEYYQLTCDSLSLSVDANETEYILSDLQPGTYYTVYVAACASSCSAANNATNNTCRYPVYGLINSVNINQIVEQHRLSREVSAQHFISAAI